MATKSLPTRLPPRTRLVVGGDGKTYLTGKSRRRYKTPKAVRNKIAASARRLKIPVLTTAAVGIPFAFAFAAMQRHGGAGTAEGWKWFGSNLIAYYTGYAPMTNDFDFKRLGYGLLPLVAVSLIRKSGITRTPNAMLAKMRIPLRLS